MGKGVAILALVAFAVDRRHKAWASQAGYHALGARWFARVRLTAFGGAVVVGGTATTVDNLQ
jgi:hypothetical protein